MPFKKKYDAGALALTAVRIGPAAIQVGPGASGRKATPARAKVGKGGEGF